MNNKPNPYIEYIKTSLITMVFVIIVSAGILIYSRVHMGEYISEEEFAIKNNMIGYLISKYRHFESLNPKDASINLKIGQLYELLGSYNQAEDEYILALDKRGGYYQTALFRLAGINVLQGEYNNADLIMGKIRDSARYSVVLEKAKYYKLYGDVLSERAYYEDAIKRYNQSLFYFDKISRTMGKDVRTAMCKTYVGLADYYVSQNKTKRALNLLETTKSECKEPIVLYKLALLSLDENPEYSVQLLETVVKQDPTIVNFTIYKKILFSLKMQYAYARDFVRSELYDAKLSRLRSFIIKNVLEEGELLFTDFKFVMKKFSVKNEYDFVYNFEITNITNQDIPKLYAIVELYDKKGNRIHVYTSKLVSSSQALKAGSEPIKSKVILRMKKDILSSYSTVTAKLYLAKDPKVKKLLYMQEKVDVTKGKKNK